jgi:Ca2+-binding RTX toxin-like protein
MTTLQVLATTDYRGTVLNGVTAIVYHTHGPATATFVPSQFGPGLITDNVAINGDTYANTLVVQFAASGQFSAASWTFSNWDTGQDLIVINGWKGNDRITGSAVADQISGLSGDDQLNGGNGNDTLNGGDGNDNLSGGDGDDTLSGGGGEDDVLNGGAGIDTVSYVGTPLGPSETYLVDVNLDEGYGYISGGIYTGTDSLSQIENAWGSSYNDQLVGDDQANLLEGFSGDDNIVGGAGNDTLLGDSGNDVLGGNAGADTMIGGSGVDSLYYLESPEGIVIDLASGAASGGDAEGDVFSQIEHVIGTAYDDSLYGDDFANVLYGEDGDDILQGRGGNDSLDGSFGNDLLDGGTGADTLYGYKGNDTYVVDNAGDTVTEDATSDGTDLVKSSVSFVLPSNIEKLSLTGSANINGGGNGLANSIVGNTGNNTLSGGSGNDTLRGGHGSDTVTGGSGADVFVFADGDGFDTVTDFANGSDRFNLKGVPGVDSFSDLDVIDNGATVTVDYGTGSFTISNVGNPALIDASDFIFA